MDSTIPFPDYRRVNPRREIRESSTPAPVVFDFGAIHEQNTRRHRFHEIMSHIDVYSAEESRQVESRQDIFRLLLHAMVEVLKEMRYELDLDGFNALSYIAMTVMRALIETEPHTFITPRGEELSFEGKTPAEEVILAYAFAWVPSGHPSLEGLKHSGSYLFASLVGMPASVETLSLVDTKWMYGAMAEIFPLVIDRVKMYMGFFPPKTDASALESANEQ